MADRKLLDPERINNLLLNFPGWIQEGSALSYQATFKDFVEAFSFITKVALISEKLNHHATIQNTYNKVVLTISTHSAGGITALDFSWLELLYTD